MEMEKEKGQEQHPHRYTLDHLFAIRYNFATATPLQQRRYFTPAMASRLQGLKTELTQDREALQHKVKQRQEINLINKQERQQQMLESKAQKDKAQQEQKDRQAARQAAKARRPAPTVHASRVGNKEVVKKMGIMSESEKKKEDGKKDKNRIKATGAAPSGRPVLSARQENTTKTGFADTLEYNGKRGSLLHTTYGVGSENNTSSNNSNTNSNDQRNLPAVNTTHAYTTGNSYVLPLPVPPTHLHAAPRTTPSQDAIDRRRFVYEAGMPQACGYGDGDGVGEKYARPGTASSRGGLGDAQMQMQMQMQYHGYRVNAQGVGLASALVPTPAPASVPLRNAVASDADALVRNHGSMAVHGRHGRGEAPVLRGLRLPLRGEFDVGRLSAYAPRGWVGDDDDNGGGGGAGKERVEEDGGEGEEGHGEDDDEEEGGEDEGGVKIDA